MPINPILVVGGAGYIGSNMVHHLQQASFVPVVLDNLSTGHRDALNNVELIVGDLNDPIILDDVFSRYRFSAVMHFAGSIQVAESMSHPALYYQNNVTNTLNLLTAMLKHGVSYFIFSSSAAVYGAPQSNLMSELHPTLPINPYGHTKRMIEIMLSDFSAAYDFRFMALRYFNAAGAGPMPYLQERHHPETHLIPLVLQVARGERSHINIYGHDYTTFDGTCVRDYIHVTDLCEAHSLALQALLAGKESNIYNLGTGIGHSVKQVIEIAEKVTQTKIPSHFVERRLGDPAILVADPQRAMQELGWQPRCSTLETMLRDAYSCLPIEQM